jgi:hypothetical protein
VPFPGKSEPAWSLSGLSCLPPTSFSMLVKYLANHTHSVWTDSSQSQMINLCRLPSIRKRFSGLVFESYARGEAFHRRNLRIAHACTETTSAGSNAVNGTSVSSTSSNWRMPYR